MCPMTRKQRHVYVLGITQDLQLAPKVLGGRQQLRSEELLQQRYETITYH